MKKLTIITLAILLILPLGSCGVRGDLTLPADTTTPTETTVE